MIVRRFTGPPEVAQNVSAGQQPVHSFEPSNFTAVAHGTPEFPDASSAGPRPRGKNFIAGGPDGAVDTATQRDSLSSYASWIRTGRAAFTLSGWAGDYSDQNDDVLLTVQWANARGAAIGSAALALARCASPDPQP